MRFVVNNSHRPRRDLSPAPTGAAGLRSEISCAYMSVPRRSRLCDRPLTRGRSLPSAVEGEPRERRRQVLLQPRAGAPVAADAKSRDADGEEETPVSRPGSVCGAGRVTGAGVARDRSGAAPEVEDEARDRSGGRTRRGRLRRRIPSEAGDRDRGGDWGGGQGRRGRLRRETRAGR